MMKICVCVGGVFSKKVVKMSGLASWVCTSALENHNCHSLKGSDNKGTGPAQMLNFIHFRNVPQMLFSFIFPKHKGFIKGMMKFNE